MAPITDRRLDRLPEFDDRSRAFNVADVLPRAALAPRSYSWRCKYWLDQGQEGACVGFAWAHELAARPTEVRNVTDDTARGIYHKAQTLDQWEGENYEGTSVIAGIKAIKALYPPLIGEYRWAFNFDDLVLTLGYKGPVVLGINWYSGMFVPDARGLVRVTGEVAGGHAILARGVSIARKEILLRNSWGTGWGANGDCYIGFEDVKRLLKEGGEACVPLKRAPSPASV